MLVRFPPQFFIPSSTILIFSLNYGGDPCVLDKAVKSYYEQMERKRHLDLSVKLWLGKSESGRVGIEGNRGVVSEKASKDGHSVVSRSSSRLSSMSQKRAKRALAQLNIHRPSELLKQKRNY